MKTNELNFLIGGFAGQGVNTVGDIFSRLCRQAGLSVFVNMEYPSNIKGEHNYIQIRIAEDKIGSTLSKADLVLALDAKSVFLHKDSIVSGGAIINDKESPEISHVDIGLKLDDPVQRDVSFIDVPFVKIANEAGGTKKMINSIGLGAVMGLLSFDFEALAAILRKGLSKFDDTTIEQNITGANIAYDMTNKTHASDFNIRLKRREPSDYLFLTGNEAIALGAIKAGVKFYSGYPMTPSSSVLNFMAKKSLDYDLVAIQTEDEISAAGMAIGASFSGIRAMTGTSGGGFCLMSEYFGLAGMTETPIVILEAQRPGPATGLPTRTEQADLKFVLSAHQGDFPRIVVAPGDPNEAFLLTCEAFNLAEIYQTPVVILSDKHLSESFWTIEPFDLKNCRIDRGQILSESDLEQVAEYKRYRVTESGISPRTLPGIKGGIFKASGNEHQEDGYVSEDADNRKKQTDKRMRKTALLDVGEIGLKLHGDKHADTTLVGWGSTKSVILEAIAAINRVEKHNCNFLQIIYMEPFPSLPVATILEKSKNVILIENNATGQLGDLICEKTGKKLNNRILKYNGRQFFKDELVERITQKL